VQKYLEEASTHRLQRPTPSLFVVHRDLDFLTQNYRTEGLISVSNLVILTLHQFLRSCRKQTNKRHLKHYPVTAVGMGNQYGRMGASIKDVRKNIYMRLSVIGVYCMTNIIFCLFDWDDWTSTRQ